MPHFRRIGMAAVFTQFFAFRFSPMMIRCRDRGVGRARRRPAATVSPHQRLKSMFLLMMPLLSHAEPLITPATPLSNKASVPIESATTSDAQAIAPPGEASRVNAAGPSRAVKPASPRSAGKAPDGAASRATPGLYLSRVDDQDELRSRFRFAGLLRDAFAQADPSVPADSKAPAKAQVPPHSKRLGHAQSGATRVPRPASTTETAQASDPCLRTHGGTLVIRTGQADGPCSGAEFRARMSRQLKAAMAEIDSGASDAGSAVRVTPKRSAGAHHAMLTAPPFSMALVARAPGEDNLRRLNSRVTWAEQYQSRISEIRMGQ